MNSLVEVTSRRIAVIVAVLGTIFTVGGTLTLADHYAHREASARILVQASV